MAAMELNKEQFEQLLQEGKPFLVDFGAPWCSYCRRIAPAYRQIAQQWQDKLVVAQVDIDREPQLAQEQQIEVIPTLVFYRGGQAVASIVAPESKAMIENFILENLG